MKIVCSICGSTIYDSDDLSTQQSANMCSICRRVICDKCFYSLGQICSECDAELTQSCTYFDCIANLRGRCITDFCSGRFLPNDQEDKESADQLSAAQRRDIYDALAEELRREFGIEVVNIEDITIIEHVNLDYIDSVDDDEDEEDDFDDTVDYGDEMDFDFEDEDYEDGLY